MKRKKDYDMTIVGKAMATLALRLAVAGYIIYLVVKILAEAIGGEGPIPLWATWLICAVFAVCAMAFCAFAVWQFKKSKKAAELPRQPQETEEELPAASDGDGTDGPEK